MNFPKFLLPTLGVLLIVFVAYKQWEHERFKMKLRNSSIIYEAEIIELKCGRRDKIKFKLNDKIVNQRIYLSEKECAYLKNQRKIRVKIDTQNDIIVFANEDYNDWHEAESISIFLLASTFIFLIIYKYLKSQK